MRKSALLLALVTGSLLTACSGADSPDTPPSTAHRATASIRSGADTPALEQAALASGIIADAQATSPVGLYQHRHEAGSDVLCIAPGSAGNQGDRFRFALQVEFGEDTQCQGSGTGKRIGDNRLLLNFARSSCLIIASYEGDRIALPGALDLNCRSLCTNRGALDGVSFPRTGHDARSATSARDKDGAPMCAGA